MVTETDVNPSFTPPKINEATRKSVRSSRAEEVTLGQIRFLDSFSMKKASMSKVT